MRKYSMCGAECVHMLRYVPRSYDMSRTHIIHKSVNHQVDVVLRCSPKYWKKKKVRVRTVEDIKKKRYVKIRVSAKKGYVAVRKTVNENYEKDRKNVYLCDPIKVVRYSDAIVSNRPLIHDMKSQISIMAKKSASYMDNQFMKNRPSMTAVTPVAKPKEEAVVAKAPDTYNMPEKPVMSLPPVSEPKNEAADTKFSSKDNPYASSYSSHIADDAFRSLMSSLEKSLNEACRRCEENNSSAHEEKAENAGFVQSGISDYPQSEDFSLSVTNADIQPNPQVSTQSTSFEPVSISRAESGEFTFSSDKLSSDNVDTSIPEKAIYQPAEVSQENEEKNNPVMISPSEEEEYKPVTMFPSEEEEEYKSVNIFPNEEEEEYKPVNIFPNEEEEEYKPVTIFPNEEEEEYKPVNIFPSEEEEEYKPITIFPNEEEEEYKPVTIFPNEEVENTSAPQTENAYAPDVGNIPQNNTNQYNSGYDGGSNSYGGYDDYDNYQEDTRESETFFSRTGNQIKKVIGVIRGSASNLLHRHDDDDYYYDDGYGRDDVEITYSDRDDR